MGSAFNGVNRVGEGVDALGVARVPLQRDLDLVLVALGVERDDRRVDRGLGLVDGGNVVL